MSTDVRSRTGRGIARLALATFVGLGLSPTVLLGQEDPAQDRAQIEKELPPPGGPPRDFRIPAKETLSLDNGLQVTLVPYGVVPKVNVQLVVRTGDIDEAADEVWLARASLLPNECGPRWSPGPASFIAARRRVCANR